MIINEKIKPTKIAKLIGVSRHQLAWRIGWTKVRSGWTCNYARTLHDGRVLASWACPYEPDHIFFEWPDGFYYIFLDQFNDDYDLESADEKLLVQRELVLQMISVVKYGQDQHRLATEMLIKVALDRLKRPERGLIKLFQTWNK